MSGSRGAGRRSESEPRMNRPRSGSERRLTAQYAVTRVLAEAESLGVAAPRILKAVCQSLGWELGAIWRVDGDAGVLRCVATWREDSADLAEFEQLTWQSTFAWGVGLPGRVWEARAP